MRLFFRALVACLLVPLMTAATLTAQEAAKTKDRVDDAVERALSFLAIMQEKDGSWHAHGTASAAITGLAVMAFLSAGHVPGEGPYQANVEKGIRWIIREQKPHGAFTGELNMGDMYHQGICTLALAEAAGMTDLGLAADLKPTLEKAVRLILRAQRTEPGTYRGGWRYQIDGPDADVSVTGWQVLALRAAKNLGCDVPAERIDQAVEFIQRCRDPRTGGFCYVPGGRLTSACTGTSILVLELVGKDRHLSREALQGGTYLLKTPPSWSDEYFFYTTYYCSQAMFQLGNNYWSFYRPQMHKVLLDNQQRNGSWINQDFHGPNYGTAMAVLALTVEYRFLPIYQRNEGPAAKK